MSDASGNRLDELLRRVHALTGSATTPTAPATDTARVESPVRPTASQSFSTPTARGDEAPHAVDDEQTIAPTRRPAIDPRLSSGHTAFQRSPSPLSLAPERPSGPSPLPTVAIRRAAPPMTHAGSAIVKPGASARPLVGSPERERSSFVPAEPASLAEAGVNEGELEAILLKFLLARSEASGRQIAEQVRLPLTIVDQFLRGLKGQQLIAYKAVAAMNDPICVLSDVGRERARRYNASCTYYGSATVTLKAYIDSVTAQSIQNQAPTRDDLERAFADLLISDRMMKRLGPAVNSGRGMFLFGAPGNGKTSIAERVTAAFGEAIWVPRAINIEGQITRLFDPATHEEMPLAAETGFLSQNRVDHRWVRIRRPTIIAGGELTMDNLEVSTTAGTGVCEAPLQMKSNCGTLVIDDFGRQKMSVDELLNRWIVPLEKRYDFLNMPGGKKIQVPFDQLIVFSTNLEPRDLCDDAFLRRIPYKIEVVDPTEDEFRRLFKIMCPKMGFEHDEVAINDLIERHYKPLNRPYRCCQPRDLLLQVRNLCRFENLPMVLNRAAFDAAVENYFAIM